MKKRIIFTDSSVVEFCKATQDTNEVHDPAFMEKLGKRVIVPGMFAFSATACLTREFLLGGADYIRVYFNTLLSSGDFADLCVYPNPDATRELRLSAINHKDTLSSAEKSTVVSHRGHPFIHQDQGIVHTLPAEDSQFTTFARLIGCDHPGISDFLFTVAYASQALYRSIASPQTEIEQEIDRLINRESKVSPFYHTLEISLPIRFPQVIRTGTLDYRIHFEREKKNRAYVAHLQCEQDGTPVYRSTYRLVGIPDRIILRMAKDIRHPDPTRAI